MKLRHVNLHSLKMITSDFIYLQWLFNNGESKAIHLVNSFTVTKLAETGSLEMLNSEYCIADGKYLSYFFKLKRMSVLYMRGNELFKETLRQYPNSTHVILGSPKLGLTKFENILSSDYPNHKFLTVHEPPFTNRIQSHIDFASTIIKEFSPDFIWIAIGTPKQDVLASELSKSYSGNFIAIGAAINFLNQKESPIMLQTLGLEWLYRLLKEPRRLWRRYLVDGPKFIYVFVFNLFKQRN